MNNSLDQKENTKWLPEYKQLLIKAEWEYLKLVTIINEKLATLPAWSEVFKNLKAWILRDETQIQYWDRPGAATWGNMEWSLYTDFEGHALRTRRSGDNAIYLDDTGNYFKVSWWLWEKHLIPKRIGWEDIVDINKEWVIVIDNALVEENYNMKNHRHKTVGKDIGEQRKKVLYKIKQLFSKEKEKSILDLEPKGRTRDEMQKTIDINTLNQNLGLVVKWLQKTIQILEEELSKNNS